MPDDIDMKHGQIVLRPALLSKFVGNESLVITGSSRGGTSIIAYALIRADTILVPDWARKRVRRATRTRKYATPTGLREILRKS